LNGYVRRGKIQNAQKTVHACTFLWAGDKKCWIVDTRLEI